MSDFKIASKDFQQNPIPILMSMVEAGPAVDIKLPVIGPTKTFVSYKTVNELLRDSSRFARDGRAAGKKFTPGVQWWMPKFLRSLSSNMLAKDGAEHRRLRNLVDQAFQKRNVDAMRDPVETIADGLLDKLEDAVKSTDSVDLMKTFSQQFPLAVICELLGLPDEDRPKFSRWFAPFSKVNSIFSIFSLLPGLFKIRMYLKKQIADCRANPRPGLIHELIVATDEGQQLSEEELIAMIFLLLVAGHETTTHLISGGLVALLSHPQELQRLKEDWSQAPTAIDEILRYTSPVQMTKPRFVTSATQLDSVELTRGQVVIGFVAAANFDASEFPDPLRFDIQRSPNRHLTFGSGIHVCLGLKLAKLETAVALERLFVRFPKLQLAVKPNELNWRARIGLRCLGELPVKLS